MRQDHDELSKEGSEDSGFDESKSELDLDKERRLKNDKYDLALEVGIRLKTSTATPPLELFSVTRVDPNPSFICAQHEVCSWQQWSLIPSLRSAVQVSWFVCGSRTRTYFVVVNSRVVAETFSRIYQKYTIPRGIR